MRPSSSEAASMIPRWTISGRLWCLGAGLLCALGAAPAVSAAQKQAEKRPLDEASLRYLSSIGQLASPCQGPNVVGWVALASGNKAQPDRAEFWDNIRLGRPAAAAQVPAL